MGLPSQRHCRVGATLPHAPTLSGPLHPGSIQFRDGLESHNFLQVSSDSEP